MASRALTKTQQENLRVAYVCQVANGISAFCLSGDYLRALERRGLATSQLGGSINGGSSARRYRLTSAGRAAGAELEAERVAAKRVAVVATQFAYALAGVSP